MGDDKWRIPLIKEVMDMKSGNTSPPEGWTLEEMAEILDLLHLPAQSNFLLSAVFHTLWSSLTKHVFQ